MKVCSLSTPGCCLCCLYAFPPAPPLALALCCCLPLFFPPCLILFHCLPASLSFSLPLPYWAQLCRNEWRKCGKCCILWGGRLDPASCCKLHALCLFKLPRQACTTFEQQKKVPQQQQQQQQLAKTSRTSTKSTRMLAAVVWWTCSASFLAQPNTHTH